MKYSIILPTYNREKTINNAILSVINQTYKDYELIIVDDGSTDGTAKLIDNYEKKYANIHVVHNAENMGVSKCRNIGIQLAQGEYILFLDDDDVFTEDALQYITDNSTSNEDLIVFGLFDYLPSKDLCDRTLQRSIIRDFIIPEHINIHNKSIYFLEVFIINKCFKKDLILENNITFDEYRRNWEDHIFVIRYLKHCSTVRLLHKCLYRYGNIPLTNHISQTFYPLMAHNFIKAYQDVYALYHDDYDFDQADVNTRYYSDMNRLLSKIEKACPKSEFEVLLRELIQSDVFKKWINASKLTRLSDRMIRYAYNTQRINLLRLIYQLKK